MMREYHVRICERLGVKLPGPTRHLRPHLAGEHAGGAGADEVDRLCHGNVNEYALRAKTRRDIMPLRQRGATLRQLRLGRSAVWIGR